MLKPTLIRLNISLIHLLIQKEIQYLTWGVTTKREWRGRDEWNSRLFTTWRIIYVFSFVINFAAQHDIVSHTIEQNILPCACGCWIFCRVLPLVRIEVYIVWDKYAYSLLYYLCILYFRSLKGEKYCGNNWNYRIIE